MLVTLHDRGLSLWAGDLDGRDLLGSPIPRRGRLLLAAQGEFVLFLAGDGVARGQVLGGLAHDQTAQGIEEAVPVHAVVHRGVTHPVAEPHAVEEEGSSGHVLLAPRQDDLGVAQHDLLGGDLNGLGPRPARHVHRECRLLLAQAAAVGDLAGRVRAVARLAGVAEHQLVDVAGVDPRPRQRRLRGVDPQVDGGDLGQRPEEPADRCPRALQDDRSLHEHLSYRRP